MLRIKSIIFIFILFSTWILLGQEMSSDSLLIDNEIKFKYSLLIIPSALIGYGFFASNNDKLKAWDLEIKEELNEEIDRKFTIDDYTQYVPALSVYALNGIGIKGKHNFKDGTIILATSYFIMSSTVISLKFTTKIKRPDNSSNNSFPSGHTATAFMGAEFLWQEYKDVSFWYGVAGYTIATGTGFFRMYNNKHWLKDVIAGAGIGILSTKIAYWLNPYLTEKIFNNVNDKKIFILYPYYDGERLEVTCSLLF